MMCHSISRAFHSLLRITCLSALIGLVCTGLWGQVTVAKSAGKGNPSVAFNGISGNSAVSSVVSSDLKNCGWFDVTGRIVKVASGSNVDYVISGTDKGATVSVTVQGRQGFAFSVKKTRDSSAVAHLIVDTILKKLFGIAGICSSKIAFCLEPKKGYKEIYVCDFDGKNLKRITKNNNLSVEPEWSPNRRYIFYTMYSKGFTDIVQYDVRTMRSRRVAQFPGLNAGAAVSPNNKVLALILSRDKQVELYLKSIDGTNYKRLTKSNAVEASPCWSPDGRKLCFASGVIGNPKLYLISSGGGAMRRLRTVGVEAVSPDWSSKNQIVYSARMGRNYTIAVSDRTTGKAWSVISAAGDWEGPSWAPDNRHVVCSRTLNGRSSLYIVDTWTKKARCLLSGKYDFSMPCWSE